MTEIQSNRENEKLDHWLPLLLLPVLSLQHFVHENRALTRAQLTGGRGGVARTASFSDNQKLGDLETPPAGIG